jgi:hypothetical protein
LFHCPIAELLASWRVTVLASFSSSVNPPTRQPDNTQTTSQWDNGAIPAFKRI